MGIRGLLTNLRSVTHRVHVSAYARCKVAVDAHSWLYRGAYACSLELLQEQRTDRFVRFCMDQVNLLRRHDIRPVLVFDGRSLAMKGLTHEFRESQRTEAKSRALKALDKKDRAAAQQAANKTLLVTHEMARQFMETLEEEKVEFIVAPYEADAQLAYLSINNMVELVITEDSDTLPFGTKRVLFKMDKEGYGDEIQRRDFGACQELDLVNWSDEMIVDMCLLAGCDYLPNVPGVGIRTAYKFVQEHRTHHGVVQALRESTFPLPEGYLDQFEKAYLLFRCQRVYDPVACGITHLRPLPPHLRDAPLEFLGPSIPEECLSDLVNGLIHPRTLERYPNPIAPPPPPPAGESTEAGAAEAAEGRLNDDAAEPKVEESARLEEQPKTKAYSGKTAGDAVAAATAPPTTRGVPDAERENRGPGTTVMAASGTTTAAASAAISNTRPLVSDSFETLQRKRLRRGQPVTSVLGEETGRRIYSTVVAASSASIAAAPVATASNPAAEHTAPSSSSSSASPDWQWSATLHLAKDPVTTTRADPPGPPQDQNSQSVPPALSNEPGMSSSEATSWTFSGTVAPAAAASSPPSFLSQGDNVPVRNATGIERFRRVAAAEGAPSASDVRIGLPQSVRDTAYWDRVLADHPNTIDQATGAANGRPDQASSSGLWRFGGGLL